MLFSSLDEREDRKFFLVYGFCLLFFAAVVVLSPMGAGWRAILISLLTNALWVVVLIVVVVGVGIRHRRDDSDLHDHENSMTNWQVYMHLAVYTVILYSALFIPLAI